MRKTRRPTHQSALAKAHEIARKKKGDYKKNLLAAMSIVWKKSAHQASKYQKGDEVSFDYKGVMLTGIVSGQIKTSLNANHTPQLSVNVNGKRYTVSEKRIVTN